MKNVSHNNRLVTETCDSWEQLKDKISNTKSFLIISFKVGYKRKFDVWMLTQKNLPNHRSNCESQAISDAVNHGLWKVDHKNRVQEKKKRASWQSSDWRQTRRSAAKKMIELAWEIWIYLLYSLGLAVREYYVVQPLLNFFDGVNIISTEECKYICRNFSASS